MLERDPRDVRGGRVGPVDDQVDALQGDVQRFLAIAADLDLIALPAQRAREWLGDRLVILGEQHAGHGAIVGSVRPGSQRSRVLRRTSRGVTRPTPRNCRRRVVRKVKPECWARRVERASSR